MSHRVICIALLLAAQLPLLVSCEALGYRIEWQGFKKDGALGQASDPTPSGPEPGFALTAESAWLTWHGRHQDLGRAVERMRGAGRPPHGALEKCRSALDTLEKIHPDHADLLAEARAIYDRIENESSRSPVSWTQRQLQRIERRLEVLRMH